MEFNFEIGKEYSRKEVKKYIGHKDPDNIGGHWTTGYVSFEKAFFIFANIDTIGRTGHDYPNLIIEDRLYWYSKARSTIKTGNIKKMLSGEYEIYIFARKNSKNVNFTFYGLGTLKDYENTVPAHIVWGLGRIEPIKQRELKKRKIFLEGMKKESNITTYERNPNAREVCLSHFGYSCIVCSFNFEENYGEVGKAFIHVHHEKEISSIGKEYIINPIEDLKPVCPNCHAMLHRRRPAYSIEEMKKILK